MAEHPFGPFTVTEINNFIPEKAKPWILLAFVSVFQLSGGVYLAAVGEMAGSTALMQQDIMMAGYAALIGLSLNFALMFRLKFRFPVKTILITCSIVLIICNLICVNTTSIPLLVFTCFILGFFRMWATFACNSTIQLWITPTRDFPVWFCYIGLMVEFFILFGGLVTGYISFLASWEYMHYFMVGLLLLVIVATLILFNNGRPMGLPYLPLYGIDWIGGLLWAVFAMSVTFVCVYGEHYEWFSSWQIRYASIFGAVILALNLWRMTFVRHPYLSYKVMMHPIVAWVVTTYFAAALLVSPEHSIEHIYTEMILGYDSIHAISLNWFVIIGVHLACGFSYLTFALRHWTYKRMVTIAFASMTGYLVAMYLTVDFNLSYNALITPMILRGFGFTIISIVLLTRLLQIGFPFQIFPQVIFVNGIVSAVLSGAVATAVTGRMFNVLLKSNLTQLGSTLDGVNSAAAAMPSDSLLWTLSSQATMVTIKEIYGLLCIAGVAMFIICLVSRSTLRPAAIHPTWIAIRRIFRRTIQQEVAAED